MGTVWSVCYVGWEENGWIVRNDGVLERGGTGCFGVPG